MKLEKELEEKRDWSDRFSEVVEGLEIDKNIAKKLANFIHYEIVTAKKATKSYAKQSLEGVEFEKYSPSKRLSPKENHWAEYGHKMALVEAKKAIDKEIGRL